ncbi:hypothetical protein A2U01_0103734, partial [Trifolium medium]|nr:hypothetical protein [Trifolium medium]
RCTLESKIEAFKDAVETSRSAIKANLDEKHAVDEANLDEADLSEFSLDKLDECNFRGFLNECWFLKEVAIFVF